MDIWFSGHSCLTFVFQCRADQCVFGYSELKRSYGLGFPRAGKAGLRDFPMAKPEGNPKEQLCFLK